MNDSTNSPSLKNKLKNNQLSIGSWITIGHVNVVEILATAGFEWLVIDLEHTSIDLYTTQILISAIQAKGMSALVRVSKNEEVVIKRVLDMGADGVIIPMVNTPEDARKAVEFVNYPPIGKRGVGLYRAQNFGIGFEAYKERVKKEIVLIAQIEHKDAVENIEAIISTPGINGTIVGPYDLSGSMGFPGEYNLPEVKKALEKVASVCKAKNFPLGFHVIQSNYEQIKDKIAEGYCFLAFSLDFFFLGDKAREEMSKLKGCI